MQKGTKVVPMPTVPVASALCIVLFWGVSELEIINSNYFHMFLNILVSVTWRNWC